MLKARSVQNNHASRSQSNCCLTPEAHVCFCDKQVHTKYTFTALFCRCTVIHLSIHLIIYSSIHLQIHPSIKPSASVHQIIRPPPLPLDNPSALGFTLLTLHMHPSTDCRLTLSAYRIRNRSSKWFIFSCVGSLENTLLDERVKKNIHSQSYLFRENIGWSNLLETSPVQ